MSRLVTKSADWSSHLESTDVGDCDAPAVSCQVHWSCVGLALLTVLLTAALGLFGGYCWFLEASTLAKREFNCYSLRCIVSIMEVILVSADTVVLLTTSTSMVSWPLICSTCSRLSRSASFSSAVLMASVNVVTLPVRNRRSAKVWSPKPLKKLATARRSSEVGLSSGYRLGLLPPYTSECRLKWFHPLSA